MASNSPNQLSFLPEDYLELKAQRRTNAICASLFAVVIVAIGGAFQITERSIKGVQTEYAEVMRRYAEAAKPIEQFRQMQEQQRKMESQAALSASLLEKVPRSFLLAELTNSLPPSVSLLEFSLEAKVRTVTVNPTQFTTMYEQKKAEIDAEKKNAVTGAKPKAYDVTLRVTGVADTDVEVAAFMTNLKKSDLLSNVNLVVSDEFAPTSKDNKLRKFQVEMTLSPTAEVKPQGPKLNKVVDAEEASAK
jgi:Tfp pilus assembly protein PilN